MTRFFRRSSTRGESGRRVEAGSAIREGLGHGGSPTPPGRPDESTEETEARKGGTRSGAGVPVGRKAPGLRSTSP